MSAPYVCHLANDPLVQEMAVVALKLLTDKDRPGEPDLCSLKRALVVLRPIITEYRGTLDRATYREYCEAIMAAVEQERLPVITDYDLRLLRAPLIVNWNSFPKEKQTDEQWRILAIDSVNKFLIRSHREASSELLVRWHEISLLRFTGREAAERRRALQASRLKDKPVRQRAPQTRRNAEPAGSDVPF